MRYSKADERTIQFAKWCIREKREPFAIMELVKLAERAAKLHERDCNGENVESRLRAAYTRFESRVTEVFGEHAKVEWPGFWPCITVCDSGFPDRRYEIRLPG